MKKSDIQHLKFLDAMRGIAILGVFLFHSIGISLGSESVAWNGIFRDFSFAKNKVLICLFPATYGSLGVSLFFVISGFCIHISASKGVKVDWRGFFLRRFFRIYPPYLVFLLFFSLIWSYTRLDMRERLNQMRLISHVLILHNFDHRSLFSINGSFWSIAVEVQLYLIYPLLLLLTRKLGWKNTILALCIVECSLRCLSGIIVLPYIVIYSPFFFWFSWSVGAYVAEYYIKGKTLPFSNLSARVCFFFLLLCGLVKPFTYFAFPVTALLAACLICKALSSDRILPLLTDNASKYFYVLGTLSYSIYLIHQPLLLWANSSLFEHKNYTVNSQLTSLFVCFCSWFVIVLISRFSYFILEKPSASIGKKLSSR